MGEWKGPKQGVGNKNSGRKSLAEELEMYKKKVKELTLEELAKSRVYKQLEKSESREDTKDFALPVALKGITTKTDITSGGEPLKGFNFISNDTNNKTDNQTGGSVEEDLGQDN